MIQQRDLMIYMDWKKTMKNETDWNLLLLAVLIYVCCWIGAIIVVVPVFIQYGINLEPSSANILYDILR